MRPTSAHRHSTWKALSCRTTCRTWWLWISLCVPTVTHKVLFVLLILAHERRRVVHVNVTEHPTALVDRAAGGGRLPVGRSPAVSAARSGPASMAPTFRQRVRHMGIEEVLLAPTESVAEPVRRAADREHPSRVPGSSGGGGCTTIIRQADGSMAVPMPPPPPAPTAQELTTQRRARRLATDEQVWALHRQGWSGEAIARQLGMGRTTVFRYLHAPTFPERKGRADRGKSVLNPYKDDLVQRWNAGCREARQLCAELRHRSYRGSYPTVARCPQRLRQAQGVAPRLSLMGKPLVAVSEPRQQPLTAPRVAWPVLQREDQRTAVESQQLTQLRAQPGELAEAITLTEDFAQLIRQRQRAQLDPWLERAAQSTLGAFRRFAQGLRDDYAAVKAGMTLPWSTALWRDT